MDARKVVYLAYAPQDPEQAATGKPRQSGK
jgi:hypothetical protein